MLDQQAPPQERQLALRWRNFHTSFQCGVFSLRDDRLYHDVTLSCSGRVLHAHRLVLASCSPHMRQLFESTPTLPHTVIVLPTVDPDIMQALLDFIYTGEVYVRQSLLGALLQLADTFKIRGLCGDLNGDKAASAVGKTTTIIEEENGDGTTCNREDVSAGDSLAKRVCRRGVVYSSDDTGQDTGHNTVSQSPRSEETGEVVVEIEQHSEGSSMPTFAPTDSFTSTSSVQHHQETGQHLPESGAGDYSVEFEGAAEAVVDSSAAEAASHLITAAAAQSAAALCVKQEFVHNEHYDQRIPSRGHVPATTSSGNKRRSAVWEYYNTFDGQLQCKLCGKLFRDVDSDMNYSSSNYWKHLRRMHNIL